MNLAAEPRHSQGLQYREPPPTQNQEAKLLTRSGRLEEEKDDDESNASRPQPKSSTGALT